MKLKEVIDKLQEVYKKHGNVDVEVAQDPNIRDSDGFVVYTVKDIIYGNGSVSLYNY